MPSRAVLVNHFGSPEGLRFLIDFLEPGRIEIIGWFRRSEPAAFTNFSSIGLHKPATLTVLGRAYIDDGSDNRFLIGPDLGDDFVSYLNWTFTLRHLDFLLSPNLEGGQ